MRLIAYEIMLITDLIKHKFSLRAIAQELGKSKTTIYYHFRKIRGKTYEPLKINTKNQEDIGEFMGLFAGDGSFFKDSNYHYIVRLHFNVTEVKFTEDLIQNVLMHLFKRKPRIFISKGNVISLIYYSKEIYNFIRQYLVWNKNGRKTYSVHLIRRNHTKGFMKGFLRGSVDSDGHIGAKNNISFASVSKRLIDDIKDYLNKFNFEYGLSCYDRGGNRKRIYHIRLRRKEYRRFITLINPRNKKPALAGVRIPESKDLA